MASRWWVGGTASWDGTAGTKWAATSGGTGGETVPTSADDVYFDANSGASTVTIAAGNTGAKSINCTGFTGTLAGSAAITVSGSVTLVAGMTVTYSGTLTINATGTLTTAGKTLGPVTVNGAGIAVTLGDALTSSGAVTVTQGTFTTNNFNVTATQLSSSNTNTRAINLGSSTLTFSASTPVAFTTTTNLTFNAGTSQINITNSAASADFGNLSYYNVAFTSTAANTSSSNGTPSFNNFSVAAPASAGVRGITFNGPQTINGTLSTTGTAGNRRVWFQSANYGIAQTLTVNGTPSLTDADFRDLYIVGTAAPISGTRIGDLRGCKGMTFSTPKTVYWNLAGAQNWSANGWATTSTGTPSTDNFPLAQDTATFTDAGSVTGTITMDSAIPYTGTVDMSGRTSAMTLSSSAGYTIYGDWKNGSGTTISGVGGLVFSGRNTQNITSAGRSIACGIAADSYGGTVQLADALDVGTQGISVTNGTFDTKNFNVTANALVSTNSNVRTITLGSSTLTLSSASVPVNIGTGTNLTFNSGTSQINCSGAVVGGTAIASNNQTFYNVSLTSTSALSAQFAGSGNTFNNISVTAPSATGLSTIIFAGNQTITGTLTVAGASPVRRIFVRSDTLGTTRTLTVGTLAATDCDFRDITIAGTAAGSSPTRAGDCGGNSGITFPAPKTVYWNLAGTQDWSATAWAPSSGGTPDINNFPLAQDTAVFDDTGAVGTVAFEASWNIGTFDASARTSAMAFSAGGTVVLSFAYGDWKFGTGVSVANTGGTINFAKRGTATITSNGVQFGCNITVDCVTGTVQLADALSLGSARTLTLTSGTFDAVTYNVTTGLFRSDSTTFVRTLKMGSGTWTLSGTGAQTWIIGSGNFTFYKGTANIVLSDTSTSARTFAGGGLSYNKLTIGGTTGTSTLTITGNNQFTELASTKTVAHTIALGSTSQTFGKWTVTGTAGNVVTVSSTSTHVLAGSATSGLDYLAMGTTDFSSISTAEFYAGPNSTGTGANVIKTAPPTPRTLYWVGGTGNWNDTARWSTSSGGGGGAAVPTSLDDVIFDSASNATSYTSTVNATTRFKSLTIAGPASGSVTLAGTSTLIAHGNVTLPATGLTRTFTGAITLTGSTGGKTLTTNGVALASAITVNGVDCGWSLGSALNNGTTSITVTNGSIDFASYNLTCGQVSSNNGNSRTIDFDTGTTTLSDPNPINFGTTETNRANLTVTAGTSQINCSSNSPTFSGNNQTFYNVSFTGSSLTSSISINGVNTFNNLSFSGVTSVGVKTVFFAADQTVNGTLTFSAGTNAAYRYFAQSGTIGTTRTITAAAVSATDVDFRDITITGAAAPVSGTRLGDCKGNSGITFPSPKTVYCRATTSANWSDTTSWAATDGGTADITYFPLAQDTAVLSATYPNSGATFTINAGGYNIGTIDMSARTTNTVTLATGSNTPTIYGNWINGAGTTLTGTATLTFAGRGSQTITSAGKTFTQSLTFDSPSGTVTLQDALTLSKADSTVFLLSSGTFNANDYNVSLTSSSIGRMSSDGAIPRTLGVGAGTWTLAAPGTSWSATSSLTITGTGTIRLTSASAKTFAGGGVNYSGITLDQGGAGTLTITGNNTFKAITNSYYMTGSTTIALGNTTQTVSQFQARGAAGVPMTLSGTSASSPGTLILTGPATSGLNYINVSNVRAYPLSSTWYAGSGSTNLGSLGFEFANAAVPATASDKFFLMFR